MEYVILIAPKVRFEKGFKGNCQVIAHQKITCEENVKLSYPSLLYLNEIISPIETPNQIEIQNNSKVIGGILMVSQSPNFRLPIKLTIAESALVGGYIYNSGTTCIKGSLLGSLYTNSLFLTAAGGEYSNHLLDCFISTERLPKKFLVPNWLADSDQTKQKIISIFE